MNTLLRCILPKGLDQWFCLMVCLSGFGIFAYHIAIDYLIVYDERIPWDAYFSFDNQSIVSSGGGVERHPLSKYFFDLIRHFAYSVSGGKANANFRIVLAGLSTLAVSFSVLQIYKYLREILSLDFWNTGLVIFLYLGFSTLWLLSFTPETYTYTLLILTTFHLFLAYRWKAKEGLNIFSTSIFAIITGGLTITNLSKIYLAEWIGDKAKRSKKEINRMWIRIASSLTIFSLLFLLRLNFNYLTFFSRSLSEYQKFSNARSLPFWDMVSSWLLGGNIIFSRLLIRDYDNLKGYHYGAVFMDTFGAILPHFMTGLLWGLSLWAVLRGWHQRWIKVLALGVGVDLILHAVLRFGLHTAYIYGGHFVFALPLLIGFLLKDISEKNSSGKILRTWLVLLACFIWINNLTRMQDFMDFLKVFHSS